MKKVSLFVLAAVLAAALTVSADAAMHGKGKGKGPDRAASECCMDEECPMMMKLSTLGLDDKQSEKAKSIHYKVKKESIKKHADRDIAEIELKEILSNDPVDLKAAEAKLKQIEALRTEMHLAHIKAREEIKTILTPEQKKKFRSMMGMRHGHHMGMGDGMMGEGMGMGKGPMKCQHCMMGGMGQTEDATPPPPAKKDAAPPSGGHRH